VVNVQNEIELATADLATNSDGEKMVEFLDGLGNVTHVMKAADAI